MSIRRETPCDLDGICPYAAESWGSCEYWCGAEEPEDEPYWYGAEEDDPTEYEEPPVYVCEGYPDD